MCAVLATRSEGMCGFAACSTFAGGRKVISPGIAHAETITTFHSARFMEDPKAVEGELNTSAYSVAPTSLEIPILFEVEQDQ